MAAALVPWLVISCFLLPAAAGGTGEIEPGADHPSLPRLDHQRVRYGVFGAVPERFSREERTGRVRPAPTETVIRPPVEEVPSFAEIEAARARATAETALEISRRAEEAAERAVRESDGARRTSEQALAAANEAIARANESIETVNRAIDRVNLINEEIRVELARLDFEREQAVSRLTAEMDRRQEAFIAEIAGLREEIEAMKVVLPAIYTVQRHDFLIRIAAREDIYGDGSHWRRIFEANRHQIRNPNLIYPGQELVIPR